MMTRADAHLDAMLRHLGAAYYESLHGRAARSDVARALDTVEEHLGEQGRLRRQAPARPAHHEELRKRRWARRVSDVMTTTVVTVDRITPVPGNRPPADPAPDQRRARAEDGPRGGRRRLGDRSARRRGRDGAGRPGWPRSIGRRWHLRKQPYVRLTAGTLMTSPAITIGPDATIPGAARLMNTHHITRLPVVDEKGKLVGIVSRRDLLSVFLRPDADVAHDARQVLDELPLADPKEVIAEVRHGVVTLTGTMRPEEDHENDLMPLALRLIWDIDGVVDVMNKLTKADSGSVC